MKAAGTARNTNSATACTQYLTPRHCHLSHCGMLLHKFCYGNFVRWTCIKKLVVIFQSGGGNFLKYLNIFDI